MIQMDSFAGSHISSACQKAVERAKEANDSVRFDFSGTEVIAHPGDKPEDLEAKWTADFEASAKAWRESPEYVEQERQRAVEDLRKRTAVMTESAQTEAELRETKGATPYTPKQLLEYIASLVDRQHDYGTCVYAMSLAAEAAFNYVASNLGVTGFQASCADLDFIRRTRGMKGPFALLKAEDALYPQSDPTEKLAEAMENWKPWLKEQATKELADNRDFVHPKVKSHWKMLAALEIQVAK